MYVCMYVCMYYACARKRAGNQYAAINIIYGKDTADESCSVCGYIMKYNVHMIGMTDAERKINYLFTRMTRRI